MSAKARRVVLQLVGCTQVQYAANDRCCFGCNPKVSASALEHLEVTVSAIVLKKMFCRSVLQRHLAHENAMYAAG